MVGAVRGGGSKKGQLDGSREKMPLLHRSEDAFEERVKHGKSDKMNLYGGRQ